MKRPGMLELSVLGLLKEREMHGYELRKELGAKLGPLWQVSWGSLYPALRRLARAGAVEKLGEPDPRRRTRRSGRGSRAKAGKGGSLSSGRRKNVYRITRTGEEMFTRLLQETPVADDAENFSLKLAFFRYLQPEMRLALLEGRRAYLMDKLAQFRANLRNYQERMDAYALSLQSHDMAATESDIAWIEELISRERAPDVARPKSSG